MARAIRRGVMGALMVVAGAVVAAGSGAGDLAAKPSDPVARPDSTAGPAVGDTRANLAMAFENEVNAKERYLVAAKLADKEGFPYVAQLFRACSRSEQVHADQHVHAIAWTGGEAKALLQRLSLGSTADNLRASIDLETYEATRMYPALRERAQADRQAEAVRSITFALGAEREHARLLTAALGTLDQRLAVRTLYVCPTCGRTTETLDFRKCPTCFTGARKFIRVT